MNKVLKGALTFNRHVSSTYRGLFERLAAGQRPEALFVGCSDSRIVPSLITGTDPGDLFVVRNVGNIVPHPDTPSAEAAALEFAVDGLGVRDIVVCGHSGCGAVKAQLGQLDSPPPDHSRRPNLAAWLRHMDPALARLQEMMAVDQAGPDGSQHLTLLAQLNVLVQIRHLEEHALVAERVQAGSLEIHGWYFEIETAVLYSYDSEVGRFIPLQHPPNLDAPQREVPAAERDSQRLHLVA